jgi:hypothetical protein
MAAVIDSPVLAISTLPGDMFAKAAIDSLDDGLPSFFQGPGESPDISGDGRGVMSPIAVIIGLGTVELAADPDPSALAKAALTLGVRDIGRSDEADVLCCRVEC